ncbi:energy transducer TonB family protein [Brevundimonas sp. SL130]|uniref:energy transducer TonB family protein n=1 Tax=Brevundimonas sp. SL130 TaxID=2995143 RepID=UPI00226D16DA|nr:energy transducer TonB [Brevundimonas sp. SL130]WAC58318.1 TonB family protein [Brevundimonas sp. SL130]
MAGAVILHVLPFAGLMLIRHSPSTIPVEEPAILVELVRAQAPPEPVSERPAGLLQVEAAASKPVPREVEKVRLKAPQDEVEPLVIPDRTPQPTASVQATPAPATTAPLSRPAPPAASASSAPSTWQARLLAHLEQNKRFPAAAQARRLQGVVHVRFTMNRDGRVLTSRIERGSGQASLDRAALDMLTRAQPLPGPPAEVAGDRIELVVPVEFFFGK